MILKVLAIIAGVIVVAGVCLFGYVWLIMIGRNK